MRSLRRRSPDCIHLAAAIYLTTKVKNRIGKGQLRGLALAPLPFPKWSVSWRTVGAEHQIAFTVPITGNLCRADLRKAIEHIRTTIGASVEVEDARDAYILRATTLHIAPQEVA